MSLLYTNKLAYGYPKKKTMFKVERFQTDSYSIRATVGINPEQTEYDLLWAGLTGAEASALVDQLDGEKGVGTVQYTPPLAAGVQQFTIKEYNVEEYPGPSPMYSISARIVREFDL